ncbi:hypothetical protein [Flagellimonas lutaonensis]|uniref:DUF3108 domain-containing protein n=1 Tax=Flagellimonas lutaonensis TaxID=516051 RepID=A0A0D5YRL5_9FLAO|nr:hypothetical protein [Allomuricauda lutaonensis]AKA34511.1 hypothetical protein VC82_856 [Allomuricauda lutaonensis]
MKKLITSILLSLLISPLVIGQSVCSQYYPMVEGATMQYTSFNKKGKEDGTFTYTVKDVEGNDSVVSATMTMQMTDKKGNTYDSEYGIKCEGDVVKIDFKSLMNEQMMSQFGDVEVDMSGTDIVLPNNLSVGQELPDANIEMKMKMGGMNMNMNVETVNRKVEKEETITTPAGTFPCVVIYSETKSKMMMANQTFPSRTWFSKGVGMVKQETYNKKGKLISRSELTALSN